MTDELQSYKQTGGQLGDMGGGGLMGAWHNETRRGAGGELGRMPNVAGCHISSTARMTVRYHVMSRLDTHSSF